MDYSKPDGTPRKLLDVSRLASMGKPASLERRLKLVINQLPQHFPS